MIAACLWVLALAAEGAPVPPPASVSPARVLGSVLITRPLTKRRIAVETYSPRGAALKVTPTAAPDLMVAEMDSVVIYSEKPAVASGAERSTAALAGAAKVLTQKNRQFGERLLVVMAGETITFPNEDPIFHNVFSLSRTKSFDLGYYPQGQTRSVTFTKPGAVEVFCHLHPHMAATVLVLPRGSVYTRPQSDGSFVLDGLPAGEVEIVAWHRAAGFFRKKLQVPAANVDFVLPLKQP